MSVTLSFGEWLETCPLPEATKRHGHRGIPSAQCSCGRFAKHLGTRAGYNGSHTTWTMTVECSRCGTVAIRLD